MLAVCGVALLATAAWWLRPAPVGFTAAGAPGYMYPYGPAPFRPSRITNTAGKPAAEGTHAASSACGACHREQHEQWSGSLHALSAVDPIYEAAEALAGRDNAPEFLRWCNGCHTPVAVLEGRVSRGISPGDLAEGGVTCTLCHTASKLTDTNGNASLVLAPDAIEAPRGWLAGGLPGRAAAAATRLSPAAHRASYKKDVLRGAEFCAACHQETSPFNGFTLQNTFEEWRTSSYAKGDKPVTCQDCHMSGGVTKREPEPGRKADSSPVLPDVAVHRLAGANTVVPMLYGDTGRIKANERCLKAAAGIALKPAAGPADELAVEVAVTNTGAGHKLPTGVELREMWVELTVTDAKGERVFVSGDVDEAGEIGARAWRFERRIADERGDEIRDHRIWRAARELSDTRIEPGATVRKTYRVPRRGTAPYSVSAALKYRGLPQSLMNVIFKGPRVLVPVTEMCRASLAGLQ